MNEVTGNALGAESARDGFFHFGARHKTYSTLKANKWTKVRWL